MVALGENHEDKASIYFMQTPRKTNLTAWLQAGGCQNRICGVAIKVTDSKFALFLPIHTVDTGSRAGFS